MIHATCHTPKQRTTHAFCSPSARTREDTIYLEIDLVRREDVSFYSGFSDDITGIFIPTFAVEPIGHPVALKLVFDHDFAVALRGRVEWIREYNPLVPETYPGIGVRLDPYGPRVAAGIASHVSRRQSLFYDDAPLDDPAERTAWPAETASPIDTSGADGDFYNGLVRDVLALMTQNLACRPLNPDVPNQAAASLEPLHARVVSDRDQPTSFIGGFTEADGKFRLFIETDRIRPVGSRVAVQLLLTDSRWIRCEGEVRWTRRQNPLVSRHVAAPGIGLSLLDMNPRVWHQAFPGMTDNRTPVICEEVLPTIPKR